MSKMDIILDPSLYKIEASKLDDDDQVMLHIEYFIEVLDFIYNNNIGQFFYTDVFESELFSDMELPWNKYPQYAIAMKTALRNKVMSNMNFSNCSTVQDEHEVAMPQDFKYPNGHNSGLGFLKTLHYAVNNMAGFLVFLGLNNQNISRPFQISCEQQNCISRYELYPIHNPYFDYHEKVRNIIVQQISFIDQNEIFPKNKYSKLVGDRYYENIKDNIRNNAIKQEVGTEVAQRNGYCYDARLSARNSTSEKKRIIFTRPDSKYYLCIDIEVGAFEVFDNNKNHLGEYKYNGTFHKPAEPDSHKLI